MTARWIVEGRAYLPSLRRAGVRPHSTQHQAIRATVRALALAESLPGLQDFEAVIPPVRPVWVRRVPNHNLWLYYQARDDVVYALCVVRDPPVPI